MAYGKIVADQIQHSSEGTVGTQYVVSGSAKAWNHYHQIGTTASKDSFNISSITDLEVSKATHNFTNNMGNANYAWSGGMTNSTATTPAGAADQCGVLYLPGSHLPATSNWTIHTLYVSNNSGGGGVFDVSIVCIAILGDLA